MTIDVSSVMCTMSVTDGDEAADDAEYVCILLVLKVLT